MTLFCTVASLKVLFMNVLEADTNVLDIEKFSQHTITDLNSGISCYCFVQSGEVYTVKGNNTHIHTHAHKNTHTYTRVANNQCVLGRISNSK